MWLLREGQRACGCGVWMPHGDSTRLVPLGEWHGKMRGM
jgi:hypothetical protein